MSNSPRDWFSPRLTALMAEAEAAGIARDVSVAVITDLVNGALSADVPEPTGENPNQDIGEPDYMASQVSGAHPSLPDEPGDAGGIGQVAGNFGQHRNFGFHRIR